MVTAMKRRLLILSMGCLITNFQCWKIVDKFSYENNEEFYHNYDFANITDEGELTGHHFPNFIERPLVNDYDSDDHQ